MRYESVELHIEELVLHGFAPGDRYRIGEAVERHLTRLLAGPGAEGRLAGGGGDVARLDAGSFNVSGASTPDAVGAQVASAIYGGLKR